MKSISHVKKNRFWHLKYLPVKDAVAIMTAEFDGVISKIISKELVRLTVIRNVLLEATDGPKDWDYMMEHHPGWLNWFLEELLSLKYIGEEY